MLTVALNQQDVSLRVKMLSNADGTPATGITAASAGHLIWYQRGAVTARVTDGGSAADLASITATHSDWGFEEIGSGWYRVDPPDAAFLEGVGDVLVGMETDAASAVETQVFIEALFKFQGKASSVTSTTTTFPAGTDPEIGDRIQVVDGTGIKQQVIITAVADQVATHPAWPRTNISATTSTILLIAGAAFDANPNVASSTLSTLNTGDLGAETAEITARLPSALTTGGNLKVDVKAVNEVTVGGAGTSENPWGPA